MSTTAPAARLIALYSPRPQQGKSEVARHLCQHGFVRVKFARPLKAMTETYLVEVGIPKDEVWDYIEGPKKEAQVPGLPKGTTSRHIQRTLGTEWGRKCIGDSMWIDLAVAKSLTLLKAGRSVVIDDMRFPNEYDTILKNGGEVWRIVRNPNVNHRSDGHSEALLEGRFFDLSLHNDKTLKVLKDGISAVLRLGHPLGQLPK